MKHRCNFGILFLIINTILLSMVASLSHFMYEISGNSILIGFFNPVNESVWEHLKFMFFPNLIWWIILYFIRRTKCDLIRSKWIIASSVALITAPLSVIFLFYSYTQAFGFESVIVDIALVFICYCIALALSFHVYTYVQSSAGKVVCGISIILILFAAFIIFTLYPPHLPIFYDTQAHYYGIPA